MKDLSQSLFVRIIRNNRLDEAYSDFENISPDARADFLCQKDWNGAPTILLAAKELAPPIGRENESRLAFIPRVLALLPEDERIAVLTERECNGKTLLHWAAQSFPALVDACLNCVSAEHRDALLAEKNKAGETVSECVANYIDPELARPLWDMEVGKQYKEKNIGIARACLEPLSTLQIRQLLRRSDGHQTAFYHLCQTFPDTISTILGMLSAEDRMLVLQEKGSNGETALHVAVGCNQLDLIRDCLESLSVEQRAVVLGEKDSKGRTVANLIQEYGSDYLKEATPKGAALVASLSQPGDHFHDTVTMLGGTVQKTKANGTFLKAETGVGLKITRVDKKGTTITHHDHTGWKEQHISPEGAYTTRERKWIDSINTDSDSERTL